MRSNSRILTSRRSSRRARGSIWCSTDRFCPATAIMVPHTRDGRVMFAIPWHGHTIVGTTDTPIAGPTAEPIALDEEIEFILETAARYLHKPPLVTTCSASSPGSDRSFAAETADDGRPVSRSHDSHRSVRPGHDHGRQVDDLSTHGRGHRQPGGGSGPVAGETVRHPDAPAARAPAHAGPDPLAVYGSDAAAVRDLQREQPALAVPSDPVLPYTGAEVVWAAREEMARTVEDVLARRCRALFLNARAAIQWPPPPRRSSHASLGTMRPGATRDRGVRAAREGIQYADGGERIADSSTATSRT